MTRRLAGGFLLALAFLIPAAHAEQAWVKGEVQLNLRTGPGTAYRIVESVATGDVLSVLRRGEGWTQVQTPDGHRGWIPAGYLDGQPPPGVRLAQVETELADLREQLAATTQETERLRESNEVLTSKDGEQQAEIRSLTEENLDLKAGERWPYLITGAAILAAGMLAGALLYRTSARRPQPRIRF